MAFLLFWAAAGALRRIEGEVNVIITDELNVTAAVLREFERAPNPRFREIMSAAVRHLHAFIRESNLTAAEFQRACAYIARLGQLTTASHNEVVLTAGSLGLSSLVCLLNNGARGTADTTANLMGPFWRRQADMNLRGKFTTDAQGQIARAYAFHDLQSRL